MSPLDRNKALVRRYYEELWSIVEDWVLGDVHDLTRQLRGA